MSPLLLLLLPSSALAATITVGASGDYPTIQGAIDAAVDGDTIAVAAGTYTECVVMDGDLDLTLAAGGGSATTILDGTGCADALVVTGDLSAPGFAISGFTVENPGGRGVRTSGLAAFSDLVVTGSGEASLDGGGMEIAAGTASLSDSTLTGNTADRGGNLFVTSGASLTLTRVELSAGIAAYGAGLFAESPDGTSPISLSFDEVEISGNSASSHGAGVFLDSGSTLSSTDGVFSGNVGDASDGVAIYAAPRAAISSTTDIFSDNAATSLADGYSGGAIYLREGATLSTNGSTLSGNTAFRGGAVYASQGAVMAFSGTSFSDNSSEDDGGAIFGEEDETLTILEGDFTGNVSEGGSGGAIALHTVGTLDITGTSFADQIAWGDGGALQLDYAIDANLAGVSFLSNTSQYGAGGAIAQDFYGSLAVSEGEFYENTASDNGGAVALDYVVGGMTFSDTTWTQNSTTHGSGGAVYDEDFGQVVFTGSTWSGNTARYDGGAVALSPLGDVTISGGTLSGNTSSAGNGGALWISPGVESTYNLVLDGVAISANTAAHDGGGVYATDVLALSLTDVDLLDNTADPDGYGFVGGGLYVGSTDSTSVLRTRFCGNRADRGGGAFVNALTAGTDAHLWTNNAFVENSATTSGGGLYWSASPDQVFRNNNLLGNSAPEGGGASVAESAVAFDNNLVAYMAAGDGVAGLDDDAAADSVFTYDDWYTNTAADRSGTLVFSTAEDGNATADPMLRAYSSDGDCTDDDLRPSAGSPLIDAGDPDVVDPDGTRSDIGAYGGPDAPLPDNDDDGYIDVAAGGDDCDDSDPTVHPGATEVPNDGVDQDCDGADLVTDTGDSGDSGDTADTGDSADSADSGDSDTGGGGPTGSDKPGGCSCASTAAASSEWAGILVGILAFAVRRRFPMQVLAEPQSRREERAIRS